MDDFIIQVQVDVRDSLIENYSEEKGNCLAQEQHGPIRKSEECYKDDQRGGVHLL